MVKSSILWTEEQQLAIEKNGKNILVSAGAGSGKTAVLTERISQKVSSGFNINQFVILTFTNKASQEMKERIVGNIEKAIVNNPTDNHLQNQLFLIDDAIISTFDSFCQKLLKEYYYLTDLKDDFQIIDDNVITQYSHEIVENIIEDELKNNVFFRNYIKDISTKSLGKIPKNLLDIFMKMDARMVIEKPDYPNFLVEYQKNVIEQVHNIFTLIDQFSSFCCTEKDNNNHCKIRNYYEIFNGISNYDGLVRNMEIFKSQKTLRIVLDKDSDNFKELDVIKIKINNLKKKIFYSEKKDNLDGFAVLGLEDLNYDLEYQEKINDLFEQIYIKYKIKIDNFKKEKNAYQHLDINFSAIKLLEENPEIVKVLKEKIIEVYVDEYQDTNQIQEYFISLIADGNVYMVGDSKQSIYRFRGADPTIFQKKFSDYLSSCEGEVLTLNQNFRSRSEVIDVVNQIFEQTMSLNNGGVKYDDNQRLIKGRNDQINGSYNVEFLEGLNSQLYSETYEAHLIARDIQDKIANKFLVSDRGNLRHVIFSDFAIIMEKKEKFDLLEEVLGTYNIPVIVEGEKDLFTTSEVNVLKNMLILVSLTSNDENQYIDNYFEQYKYSLVALARSFIFTYSDQQIYKHLKKLDDVNFFEQLKNTIFQEVIDTVTKNLKEINELSLSLIFTKILENTNFFEHLIKIDNIEEALQKIEYLNDLISNFENLNYDLLKTVTHLEKIINQKKLNVKFSEEKPSGNFVQIINVHKSKGLQYKICYFPYLDKKFDLIRHLSEAFNYSNIYGVVTDFEKHGIKNSFVKKLLFKNEKKDMISEKIRLFYVALTRAEEKIIFIKDQNEQKACEIHEINSFSELLACVDFTQISSKQTIYDLEIHETENNAMTGNENLSKLTLKNDLIFTENNFINTYRIKEKASSSNVKITNKNEEYIKNIGTNIHEQLEQIDFRKLDYEINRTNGILQQCLVRLQKFEFMKSTATYYPEFQFIYEKNDKKINGIIDLLIENEDEMIILDYKLSDVEKKEYDQQLRVYFNYLQNFTEKKIKGFLFSINQEKIREIDFYNMI